jgi:hypothetical protein
METTMDKSEGQKKPKIHGTLVKVTDDNADEVAKAIMERIRKVQRSKGH